MLPASKKASTLLEVRREISGIAVGVIVKIRDIFIRQMERQQSGQVRVVERSIIPRQEFFEFLNVSQVGHFGCFLA